MVCAGCSPPSIAGLRLALGPGSKTASRSGIRCNACRTHRQIWFDGKILVMMVAHADANRPWSDEERDAVAAPPPAHMRLPITLMMYCGLDPQDAIRIPPTAVSDGRIDARRGKTGVAMWFDLPAPVIETPAVAPKHDAISCAPIVEASHGRRLAFARRGGPSGSSWKRRRAGSHAKGARATRWRPSLQRWATTNELSPICSVRRRSRWRDTTTSALTLLRVGQQCAETDQNFPAHHRGTARLPQLVLEGANRGHRHLRQQRATNQWNDVQV